MVKTAYSCVHLCEHW